MSKKNLSEDFYHNFRESTYGSEVVSADSVSPDYCLVYYLSDESEVGLGMVPMETPVLTDGDGHRLAFDRNEGMHNNHFFVLDDKVVAIGPISRSYDKRPFVELERDASFYDKMFLCASSGVQAKMFRGYVDALTSYELLSYTKGGMRYFGNKEIRKAIEDFDAGISGSRETIGKVFMKLGIDDKEDILHFALSRGEISVNMLRQLKAKAMKTDTYSLADIEDVDINTIQKAALFVAGETREDNPYEFIVDLSRNELVDFLKKSFDKLNAEDRSIVANILSHEPGYGEELAKKGYNTENTPFKLDIEKLLFDDLTVGAGVLDRSMFYLATMNMSEAQIQALRESVKEKALSFFRQIDYDINKIEVFVDKQLNSWFRPWTRLAGRMEYHLNNIQESDAGPVSLAHIETEARSVMADPAHAPFEKYILGWIRNRCVDYGLDYTKIPKDLQYEGAVENFKKEFPELVNGVVKAVCIEELTSLPLDYERQLEITGRIDGPVCLSNPGGEDVLVCVQKDGNTLISMRSDDIMSAIDKITDKYLSSQEDPVFSINVDGQHYQMRKDNYDSFKYGQGAYAVNAETGEKAYLIFDVKEKKVVKTEKFETVLSKKLQEEKSKADKAMAQSIGQKATVPKSKNGIK